MRIRHTMLIVPVLFAGLMITMSCKRDTTQASSGTNRVEDSKIVNMRTPVLEQATQKRESRMRELKAMDVPRLARELETESQKGGEPFNSLAYSEAVSRGEGLAAGLVPLMTKPDRSSLFGLLALHKVSPNAYRQVNQELRVNALIDALKTSKYFNTWGLPHLHWEDAAKTLIEEGRAAEKGLTALLSDKRDAPVWGGEDFAEYQRYKYRVCDYAWAMLNEIRGQKVEIPTDPAARDRLQQAAAGPG
jgi:hypothetical protein